MTSVSAISMPKFGVEKQDRIAPKDIALGALGAASVTVGGLVGMSKGHGLLGAGIGAAVAAVGIGAALVGSASYSYDPYPYPYPYPYVPEPYFPGNPGGGWEPGYGYPRDDFPPINSPGDSSW